MLLPDEVASPKADAPSKSLGVCIDLSNEDFLDYPSLAVLIKNTGFLETLLLPKIKNENAKEILNHLDSATIDNSTLTHIRFNFSGIENDVYDEIEPTYLKIQSRLERNKKRIFTIHGGGYIGLGLMADIISQSPFNYNIFATSSDKFTNLLINTTNKFWIQHGASKKDDVTCVSNVTMVYSRDSKNIEELYIHSNMLAICLTEEGVIDSATDIALGLISRYEMDQAGLKIFVLMNKTDCAEFVENEVAKAIYNQTQDFSYSKKVLASIKFIPTMVDRIVNKVDTQTLLNQFKVQLFKHEKNLNTLRFLDSTSSQDISKQIDTILASPRKLIKVVKKFGLQFNLFNAELSFALYVPEGLPEITRLPAITAVKNLEQFILLKNKYVNGPHAILAWLGGLMGYTTIAAASLDPGIMNFIQSMIENEIAPILRAENPNIQLNELEFLKSTFIKHCKNSKNDSILRVGRDPLRKLIKGGCITGVIDICKERQLSSPTTQLEYGVALGILYALKNIDPANSECQTMRELFAKTNSYKDIICYNGPYRNAYYPGIVKNDEALAQRIITKITILNEMMYENKFQYTSRRGYSGTKFRFPTS